MAKVPQHDMLDFERQAWRLGFQRVAGIDEAGRGPLAGPVVAAAVILDRRQDWHGLADSKALPASRRERLARDLRARLPEGAWAVAVVESDEIDRTNILRATHKAMRQALAQLRPPADFVLVDGLPVGTLPDPARAIVKGDRLSASIAAASILAKVSRDALLVDCDRQFPGYGFARHKGYGTAAHLRALSRLGPCPVHRRSFAPVARLLPNQPRQTEFAFAMEAIDDSRDQS